MKIAAEDFDRDPFYVVVTVESGKIVARETRDKMGHHQFVGEHEEHGPEADSRGHGFDPAAQNRHARMAAAIADCDVLRVGGMGAGAYESIKQANIRPVVTDVNRIDEAVQAYLAGNLIDHVEHLH